MPKQLLKLKLLQKLKLLHKQALLEELMEDSVVVLLVHKLLVK